MRQNLLTRRRPVALFAASRLWSGRRPPKTHPWCHVHIYLCEALGLSAWPLMGPGIGGAVSPPTGRGERAVAPGSPAVARVLFRRNDLRGHAMTKRAEAKYKIDRRMGQNIWGRPKSPFNRREYGPGQHG